MTELTRHIKRQRAEYDRLEVPQFTEIALDDVRWNNIRNEAIAANPEIANTAAADADTFPLNGVIIRKHTSPKPTE